MALYSPLYLPDNPHPPWAPHPSPPSAQPLPFSPPFTLPFPVPRPSGPELSCPSFLWHHRRGCKSGDTWGNGKRRREQLVCVDKMTWWDLAGQSGLRGWLPHQDLRAWGQGRLRAGLVTWNGDTPCLREAWPGAVGGAE